MSSAEDPSTRAIARFTSFQTISRTAAPTFGQTDAAAMDPLEPPPPRVAADELRRRQVANCVLLDIAVPHLLWLSRSLQPRPHVACLVDADGIVLHAEGDPDAIHRLGLSPGHDWSARAMGTSGAGTALATGVPVAVVGCVAGVGKDRTCVGTPILDRDGKAIGAIGIRVDVPEGDPERLIAGHLGYTISQELARRQAEAGGAVGDDPCRTAGGTLAAEQHARAEAEAALAREREAEAALRQSEARLTLALDKAAMGTWELDLATGDCDLSEQTAALFGLPRGASAGTLDRIVALIHPEDRAAVLQAKDAAASGGAFEVEFRTVWPDGTLHWINGKGHVAPTSDGGGLRLIGIAQDVTRRRQAEAALQLSEHRLQAIIDSTPAVVYVVDGHGRFRLINRHFAEVFGLDPGAVVGRLLHDCFPPQVADQFAANNQRVLESRGACEFEEVVPVGGDLRTYLSVKAPLPGADGMPGAICGVSTDITERKRLTSALELAQRQKDMLVATVAHELRQPLGAIQSALAVMEARASRESGARARGVIERQLRQLSRMVDDLLDAARIAQGKLTLRCERIVLQDVLEVALTVVQPVVRRREQHVHLEIPQEPVWLEADPHRLQQVFSNLLTNAAKFTGPGGDITVSVERTAEAVAVRVADTGQGIPAELLPRVFDMFAQAAPEGGGIGIGLAVVRGLVERHGGTVQARSEGPGRGSEFIVRLPLAAA